MVTPSGANTDLNSEGTDYTRETDYTAEQVGRTIAINSANDSFDFHFRMVAKIDQQAQTKAGRFKIIVYLGAMLICDR